MTTDQSAAERAGNALIHDMGLRPDRGRGRRLGAYVLAIEAAVLADVRAAVLNLSDNPPFDDGTPWTPDGFAGWKMACAAVLEALEPLR